MTPRKETSHAQLYDVAFAIDRPLDVIDYGADLRSRARACFHR
jgi:hypothetical protein